MTSGLYEALVTDDLILSHEDAAIELAPQPDAWKIIQPQQLNFISHPYEWSFSQLKDAALLTLEIQNRALEFGMTLKDASAYNIQFQNGSPVFIDTLSFQNHSDGAPWGAYRQFCQHFLAPLALMSTCDIRLSRMLQLYIDGIPLDIASKLLPFRAKLRPSLAMHIILHARSQRTHQGAPLTNAQKKRTLSTRSFLALLDNLKGAVERLKWQLGGTEWHDYYDRNNNYGAAGLSIKDALIEQIVSTIKPDSVWDLGANVGRYSQTAAKHANTVVAWDIDPTCVESNYLHCRNKGLTRILPLFLDLTNPSPRLGWSNAERASLIDRGPVDLVLALGLIHHLAISNNVPLLMIAEFLANICRHLIIEFVPKHDLQVIKLLATRDDVFAQYHPIGFESAFTPYFDWTGKTKIQGTERTIYAMVRK